MSVKKRESNITDQELTRLVVRDHVKLTKSEVPWCWGQPILTRPECNHLVKPPKSSFSAPKLCRLRKSCLLAYAESPHRLNLDITKTATWEDVVALVKAEEKRIGCSNEIPSSNIDPKVESDDMEEMPQLQPEETKKMDKPVTPKTDVKKSAEPVDGSIRSLVVEFLKNSESGLSKTDIVRMLEEKLQRKPLNIAAEHKISLALQPKTQKEYGYVIEKERRDGVWFYKLAK